MMDIHEARFLLEEELDMKFGVWGRSSSPEWVEFVMEVLKDECNHIEAEKIAKRTFPSVSIVGE